MENHLAELQVNILTTIFFFLPADPSTISTSHFDSFLTIFTISLIFFVFSRSLSPQAIANRRFLCGETSIRAHRSFTGTSARTQRIFDKTSDDMIWSTWTRKTSDTRECPEQKRDCIVT